MKDDGYFYDEENDIEYIHLLTANGCRISVNGQGHFPCDIKEHSVNTQPDDNDDEPTEVNPTPSPEWEEGQDDPREMVGLASGGYVAAAGPALLENDDSVIPLGGPDA